MALIRKKDGSTWFVIDYRQLNDMSKDNYFLPRTDDTLDILMTLFKLLESGDTSLRSNKDGFHYEIWNVNVKGYVLIHPL